MSLDCHSEIRIKAGKNVMLSLFEKIYSNYNEEKREYKYWEALGIEKCNSEDKETQEEYYINNWGPCSSDAPTCIYNPISKQISISFYTVHNYPFQFLRKFCKKLLDDGYDVNGINCYDDGNCCEYETYFATRKAEVVKMFSEGADLGKCIEMDGKLEKEENEAREKVRQLESSDLPF